MHLLIVHMLILKVCEIKYCLITLIKGVMGILMNGFLRVKMYKAHLFTCFKEVA